MGASDKVFSTHRCHAHYLASGGSLEAMVAELYGLPEGCNGGRGGSMHLFGGKTVASMPIVGSSIPVACGAALASKLSGDGGIAVVFFGDAACEEGVFHESMNIASLLNLPVLFVCENNKYSINTPIHERQPGRPLIRLADAHNIRARHVWENNVDDIAIIAQEAVDYIRANCRPFFLCFDTYRYAEHCGVNERPDMVVNELKHRDPLAWINVSDDERDEIKSEITQAFNLAQEKC